MCLWTVRSRFETFGIASLTSIDLSRNVLCGVSIDGRGDPSGTFTAEGITALADALRVCASVTKILVGSNRLGDEGATVLCNALRESKVTNVHELDLSHNDIGPQGAKAVAAMAAVVASVTQVC